MALKILPPCHAACPAFTDTREYVRAVAEGRYEDALEILLAANPMASVCGRICHHPCEVACRRTEADSAISLRAIKRFITDATKAYRKERSAGKVKATKKKVAVVGSGPAGLTAALDLALSGVKAVVYERDERPGGMLGATIPRYRLPYEVIEEDIADIKRVGVEIKTGAEVGKDVKLNDLLKEYDAVVLALGLAESRSLAVPGVDLQGILLAIEFLRDARRGTAPKLKGPVVVIGGGNVAMDVARTAVRLGAESVTAVALESAVEMPAHKWEIDEAREEGVKIINSFGPMEFKGKGRVKEVVFKRCTRVFDENKRFSPQYDEKERITLPANDVILAIGQRSDTKAIEGSAVKEASPGRIQTTKGTATTVDKVFLAGEVVTGPGSAVEAVASGHRTAAAVLKLLGVEAGEKVARLPEGKVEPDIKKIPPEVLEKMPKRNRLVSPMRDAHARVGSFDEVEDTLTETDVRKEAARCVACGLGAEVDEDKCVGCYTCVRICPYGVATVEKTAAKMPAEACLTCGICASECPAAAISIERFRTRSVGERVEAVLKANPKAGIVAIACQSAFGSRTLMRATGADKQAGAVKVIVPCVERLSAADIMAPFEKGVKRVVIVHCGDSCVYPEGKVRFEQRVKRAQELLKAAKVDENAVSIWYGRIDTEDDLRKAYAEPAKVASGEAGKA